MLDRMVDRRFTETDLRLMLELARVYTRDSEPGRWRIGVRLGGRRWVVVVEPDEGARRLVVVTAFAVE